MQGKLGPLICKYSNSNLNCPFQKTDAVDNFFRPKIMFSSLQKGQKLRYGQLCEV